MQFEEIREQIADWTDDAVFVHSLEEAESISPRFESCEFEGEIWIITQLTTDHNFHSPRVFYNIGNGYFSGDYALVVQGDDSPSVDIDDEASCLRAFLDILGPQHPYRAIRAVQNYLTNREDVELEIGEQEIHPDHEYRLVSSDPEDMMGMPAVIVAVVDLCDCSGVVAAKDCSRGTDDHDYLYEVKTGPHAGMYLRESASRWQGSPDYMCTLITKDVAINLAKSWGDKIE